MVEIKDIYKQYSYDNSINDTVLKKLKYHYKNNHIYFSHQLYNEIYFDIKDIIKLKDLIDLGLVLFNEPRFYDSKICKIRVISKGKVIIIWNEMKIIFMKLDEIN